jgi:hypothetical protein
MPYNTYSIIRKDIFLYAHEMNFFWKKLQREHVAEWSFLTALGCWGVTNQHFQFFAFIIAISFFTGKLLKSPRNRSFNKIEKNILIRINESTLNDTEKAKLNSRILNIKKFRNFRHSPFVIKRNWRFLLGYLFLMMSFIFNILN